MHCFIVEVSKNCQAFMTTQEHMIKNNRLLGSSNKFTSQRFNTQMPITKNVFEFDLNKLL